MNDMILEEVFAALNLAVLEMTPDGSLVFIGAPPQWIKGVCRDLETFQKMHIPGDTFTFIGNFLEEAKSFWQSGERGSIKSGIWIETDDHDEERLFEATALNASGRRLLVIFQNICDINERQTLIQKGRDLALNYQILERSDRELKVVRDDLKKKVSDRTMELEEANKKLSKELEEREMLEQDRAEVIRQLQQAQKMEAIGTLAGGIAHDFNNILSAIFGFSELAFYEVEKESSLGHKIGQILRAAERARDLVRQILTFSHQAEYEKKTMQIKLIAQEALKLLRASLPATIEIEQQLNSNAYVLADPTQMHQIIMNLCTNAGHAMKERGGTLRVGLHEENISPAEAKADSNLKPGMHVVLTVTDTGDGISPDIIGKIFDPYFTTKEKDKGTGLGLSVVHGIVTKNNGAIHVASTLGKGSMFQVFLPRYETPDIPQKVTQAIPCGNGERILFVDDELFQTDMATQMLKRMGYEVVTSNDSMQAFDIFSQDPAGFELVITDMTMPRMTGRALAGKITELKPKMPVILCSGYSDAIQPEEVIAIGIKEYLLKPIGMNDLALAVRRALTM